MAGLRLEDEEVDDVALRRLLSLRTDSWAGPSWPLDERLAAVLDVPLTDLVVRMPSTPAYVDGRPADATEWSTALVMALLQLRYHDRAGKWSALVEVRRNSMPRVLMRAAMEAVCELVARPN